MDVIPDPLEWGDIARTPKSIENYVALLLPPILIFIYLLIRRRYFKREL
jgi:hypothetical protein